MAETDVLSIRMPAVLKARVRAEADKHGVKLAEFVAEACRMRLDGGIVQMAELTTGGNACGEKDAGSSPAPASNIEDRKAIALQAMSDALMKEPSGNRMLTHAETHEAVGAIVEAVNNPCPKTGYNETDGETYRCSLAKGHKPPCRPGAKV